MKKLIIFGADDFAEIVKFYFENDSEYIVDAFVVDKDYKDRDSFCGLPVYEFESIVDTCPPEQYDMFIAIGYAHLNKVREQKFKLAKKLGYKFATYISTKLTIWGENEIGENCFLLEDNTIQPFVNIGDNVILWSGNHIGHHAVIGNNVFITSHVVISGRTYIGDNSFIGVNTTVNDHVKIAKNCVIGSGALIVKDTEEGSVYKRKETEKSDKKSNQLRYFGDN